MSSGTGAVWDTCSLARSPALKVAVFAAPCPPLSCRQHILSPLHLQPLPQPATAGQTGKAQGWVDGGYMGVNQGEKAKLYFFQTLFYPFPSPSFSPFGLPWRLHGQGDVLAAGCPMASSCSGHLLWPSLLSQTTLCLPQPQLTLGIDDLVFELFYFSCICNPAIL